MDSEAASAAYEVLPYSLQSMSDCISRLTGVRSFVLSDQAHIPYFDSYLTELNAVTLVAESEYIDRDFLADYAGYYVRCFSDYPRRCSRLHFFAIEFSAEELRHLLRGEQSALSVNDLQKNYLGFIVIKPLPETVIGRTCLRTYEESASGRWFPSKRRYRANMFGIDLAVDTIAFQEQDTVSSACATSAIWSVFQATSVLFGHRVPAPLEITQAAVRSIPQLSRTFPNEGLTAPQMVQALREVGLDPLVVPVNANYVTKSAVYAYLRGKIPVLMVGPVTEKSAIGKTLDPDLLIGHAVAIVGYRIPPGGTPQPSTHGFTTRASRIDRLYMHDDQVGPFARVVFEQQAAQLTDGTSAECLSSDHTHALLGGTLYLPTALIVPLFTTIRLPFHRIYNAVARFDSTVEAYRQAQMTVLPHRLEWDIHLISSNDLKVEYFASKSVMAELREGILERTLPRFVWRAVALLNDTPLIEFLFDATDIEQGSLVVGIMPHDLVFFFQLVAFSADFATFPNYEFDVRQAVGRMWEKLSEFIPLLDAMMAQQ